MARGFWYKRIRRQWNRYREEVIAKEVRRPIMHIKNGKAGSTDEVTPQLSFPKISPIS